AVLPVNPEGVGFQREGFVTWPSFTVNTNAKQDILVLGRAEDFIFRITPHRSQRRQRALDTAMRDLAVCCATCRP
ncbi:MAG: hypothetical protein QN155_10980, partial [Armatimonadota bacterium]|nr:hypothetical protein [Armatimonadota bacterium]